MGLKNENLRQRSGNFSENKHGPIRYKQGRSRQLFGILVRAISELTEEIRRCGIKKKGKTTSI